MVINWLAITSAELLHYTMIHEAGHAVIGDVLDIPVKVISIIPSDDMLGYILHTPAEETYEIWQKDEYLTHRTMVNARHAVIMLTMAAVEAENIILGGNSGGDSADREFIRRQYDLLGYTDETRARWDARFRRHTRILVRRYRRAILYVWRYLLKHPVVTLEELQRLLYRAKSSLH